MSSHRLPSRNFVEAMLWQLLPIAISARGRSCNGIPFDLLRFDSALPWIRARSMDCSFPALGGRGGRIIVVVIVVEESLLESLACQHLLFPSLREPIGLEVVVILVPVWIWSVRRGLHGSPFVALGKPRGRSLDGSSPRDTLGNRFRFRFRRRRFLFRLWRRVLYRLRLCHRLQ